MGNESADIRPEFSGRLSHLLSELVKLLEEAAEAEKSKKAAGGAVDKVLVGSLRKMSPPARILLLRAFEASEESARENILKGVLESCGDMAASGDRERISDSILAAFVMRLFRQMLNIEKSVAPVAADVRKEANKFRIPGHVADLKGYTLQLCRDGSMEAVEKINDYLSDLNLWIAAILYGWRRGPEEWWKEKWEEHLDPRKIEKKADGFVATFLTNKYRRFWKQYLEECRDLNPRDVKDQITENSEGIAREMKDGR